jgi:serine/threonine protein kinase
MAREQTCPELETIRDSLWGGVSEQDADLLAGHLEVCPACGQALEQILLEDDVVQLLRAKDVSRHPEVTVQNLLRRVQGLLPGSRTSHVPGQGSLRTDAFPPAPDDFETVCSCLEPARGANELGWLAHYRVQHLLGQGGMGLVFRADDTQLQRPVALKFMRPGKARDGVARQRFLREARAVAAIKHEHVVTIYQVGLENDVPFLVMELMEGESLEHWLRRGQTPAPAEVVRLAYDVAGGLGAAHARRLIHRDINPSNIFLEGAKDDGERGAQGRRSPSPSPPLGSLRPKIVDFGLACVAAVHEWPTTDEAATDATAGLAPAGPARLTQHGVVAGTPGYLAPEQARGETADARSDLFSLGCVLYRLCTGRLPFPPLSPTATLSAAADEPPRPVRDLNPAVPPPLAGLIAQLLDKDPQRRPASAQALLAALRPLARPSPPTHPRLFAAMLLSGLLALLLGVGGVLLFSRLGNDDRTPPTGALGRTATGPGKSDTDLAWRQRVAGLPAEEQLRAVEEEMKKRNPGFPGFFRNRIDEQGKLRRLAFDPHLVKDLTPLAAVTDLEELDCEGRQFAPGQISDLGPLRGLKLKVLRVSRNFWLSDLSPLAGMPLERLEAYHVRVGDLRPLATTKLRFLHFGGNEVADLAPLRGLPLEELHLEDSQFSDLGAVAEFRKLKVLIVRDAKVTDLTPLRGLPIKRLDCAGCQIQDLTPVATLRDLEVCTCGRTLIASLGPLRGLGVKIVQCKGNPNLHDLSPLKDLPFLQELSLDVQPRRDLPLLEAIATLQKINDQPAAKFLAELEAGMK